MEQQIVIEVPLHDKRSGSKAMKTAPKMDGVTKVEVVRERNHLVVTGVRVDIVKLTSSLRRIFCFAHIESVRNVTVSQRETIEEARFAEDDFQFQPSYNYIAVPVHDPDPPPICSIM